MSHDQSTPELDTAAQDSQKLEWVKPEITAFEAVTVTKGISYQAGDGVSNQS